MSDVARRSEKELKREKELRREVMTALLAMNLSQSRQVKRTKPVKKLRCVTLQFVCTRRGNKRIAILQGSHLGSAPQAWLKAFPRVLPSAARGGGVIPTVVAI